MKSEAPKQLEREINLPSSSSKKKALITGVTGQIGSYLAEMLVEKGYEVYGIIRRTSHVDNARARIDHIKDLNLFYGDLGDSAVIEKIMADIQPDEIYNLGAQSHVWISFQIPEYTADVNALGTLRICEAARKLKKDVKIYQASTSELYGGVYNYPVNENTPFYPKSPYAIAKLYAYWTIKHYREAYGMYCVNGLVFNTESPRRGENFVTRKITKGIADILKGKKELISLGNLNAKRDWNHAKDSALAMWMMMQTEKADDYVIASGETYSVREFVEEAFRNVNIEIAWRGQGLDEVGYDLKTGRVYIKVDPYYFRPSEAHILLGDASKARVLLGWKPVYNFKKIVKEMVESDLNKNGPLNDGRLEVSPADIIDRMTIVRLKLERIGNPLLINEIEACEKALESYKMRGLNIKQEWIDELYKINGEEWDLLEKMNKERESGADYFKIGNLYLETEGVNKRRAEAKNRIVEETGRGFKEIKKNHPSA